MASPSLTEQILADYDGGRVGLVQSSDKLLEALAAENLLYTMTVDPRQVGLDPSNRDSMGVNAKEVHRLMGEIATVGWSWPATAHAVCCEAKPGDTSLEEYNVMLVKGLALAPVLPNSILFGSLSCGHTNMALRCLGAAVPSSCPLLSEGGKLDLDKLSKRDTEFAKAAMTGLKWKVLRHSVRERYPAVLGLLQAALNVAGNVQQKVHEVQGLQQLWALATNYQKKGEAVNWAEIKAVIKRSLPSFVDSLDSMIAFVASQSGGLEGSFLKYFLAFHRLFVKPTVRSSVPSGLYAALSTFPHHYLAWAILEAAFTCPKEHVKAGGLCSFVSAGDVSGVLKEQAAAVQEAERYLRDVRELLPAAGVAGALWEDNQLLQPVAKMEISLARFLLKKSTKEDFKGVKEIAAAFIGHLKQECPHIKASVFEERWMLQAVCAPVPLEKRVSAQSIVLAEIDKSGKVVSSLSRLRLQGMNLGTVVARSGSADLHTISSISDKAFGGSDGILLQAFGGNDVDPEETVELEAFLKEFAVRDPKEQRQVHPFWPLGRFVNSAAAERLYLKGQVFTALGCMGSLIEDYFSPAASVQVMVKPNRTVLAAKAFQISALVLGPDTNTVKDLRVGKDEMPEKGLEAVLKPANPRWRFFLEAPKGSDLCSPAYLVSTTADSKKANVVWSTLSVASLVAFDFVGKPRPKICDKGPRGKDVDEFSPEAVNKNLVVHLPVLINTKALQQGQELLLLCERPQKRAAKAVAAITNLDIAKKARMAK
jgi:hypothetical protein